jgi:hypothetical protein
MDTLLKLPSSPEERAELNAAIREHRYPDLLGVTPELLATFRALVGAHQVVCDSAVELHLPELRAEHLHITEKEKCDLRRRLESAGPGRLPPWESVLSDWKRENAERLAVRAELTRLANGKKPDLMATSPKAEVRLEAALREALPEAREAVAVPDPATDLALAALGEQDGMFALDARLGDLINKLRLEKAAELADGWRAGWHRTWHQQPLPGMPAAWDRWRDPLQLPRSVARALWILKVRPALEDERLRSRPLLAQRVFEELLDGLTAGATAELEARPNAGGKWIVEAGAAPFADPFLDRNLAEAFIEDCKGLGGIDGFRVICGVVGDLAAAHAETGRELTALQFEHGLEELCDRYGLPISKTERAHAVLRAGQQWVRSWPGGEVGGLWTYLLAGKAHRGRQSTLDLRPSPILGPSFLFKFDERQAVPLVVPPLVGKRAWYAGTARFALALVATMVDQRRELATAGALIAPDDSRHMAERVGLELAALPKVFDRWLHDGDDAPAFLERVGQDRYLLADRPPTKAARAWLLGASTKSALNAAKGKKAANLRSKPAGRPHRR